MSRVQKIVSEVEQYNSLFGEDAAQFILDTRERERRELHDLNDRLAAYLERMRQLELQNASLEELKARWLSDVNNVKSAYERELGDAQRDLEDTARGRALLEAQIEKLQQETNDLRRRLEEALRERDASRDKIAALLRQLDEAENQLNNMNRRMAGLEDEMNRLGNENNRLQAELQKAKSDLERESMKNVEYQNQIQALLKKIESMRREYEQELAELRNKEVAVINDQYRNDLANAIREIRREFDLLANQNRQDLEAWYTKKIQEVQVTETTEYKDETRRLIAEIDQLRGKIADLEALNARLNREILDLESLLQRERYDYESTLTVTETHMKKMLDDNRALQEKLKILFETNQSLYAEIAIYRKLLDAEEGHATGSLAYPGGIDTRSPYTESRLSARGPSPVRSTQIYRESPSPSRPTYGQPNFQRASKGNVQIADISPEGRFIIVENVSQTRDEPLGEWKLVRLLDNRKELVFTFPKKFALKPGRTVTVWARNQGGSNNYVDSFVFEGDSTWGTGTNVVTILYNRDGEERASLTQTMSSSHVSNL